jgi:hypothetical protein
VKVCEPYQMLVLVEDDLKEALGVDTASIFPNRTIVGFVNEDWKPWRTPWGQEVLFSMPSTTSRPSHRRKTSWP